MLIFTVLFHKVAKLDAGSKLPYPLLVLSGIVIWNFFSGSVNKAGNSLIGASYLISKVYFPRLLVPLASVMVEIVDFLVAAGLLAAMMIYYRAVPGPQIVLLPVAVAGAGLVAIGIGLWLAALNVEYRDIQVLVPFVLQLSMYVTPVVYPLTALPDRYRRLALLNPMTGVVETFRAALFGLPVPWKALGWSFAVGLLFFGTGVYYFRRMERMFADIL